MKSPNSVRLLIAFSILLLTSLKSFSQTSDSVTCIPNDKLRLAAQLIEKGRLDSAELDIQRTNVRLLYQRVSTKNDIIRQYQLKDSTFKNIQANYDREQKNMLDQVALANRQVAQLQKDVRRQKTKVKVVGLAGIIATALTLYLTTK